MLIGMLRRKTPKTAADGRAPRRRARFSRAVAKELDEVQRASRGGWTPELAGRALAALRIAGAYAIGPRRRPAARRQPARRRSRACWSCAPFGRGDVYVSGAATTETAAFANAPAGLSDALKTLTVARYGRIEKFDSMADEAVQTAMRVTKEQQSAHSLLKEWARRSSRIGRRSAEESLVVEVLRVPRV